MVEILLVLSILGILFTVIFQAYAKTSEITLKIENEKKLMSEVILLHQFLDNISDQYYINYAAYTGSNTVLMDDNGFTKNLELTNLSTNENASITQEGECDAAIDTASLSGHIGGKKCRLQLNNPTGAIELTDPEKVYIANVMFKIYPAAAYTGNIFTELDLDKIEGEGFGIFGHIFITNFSKNQRYLQNNLPLQAFFSISR